MQLLPLNSLSLILAPQPFVLLPHIFDLVYGHHLFMPEFLLNFLHLLVDLLNHALSRINFTFVPGFLLSIRGDYLLQLPNLLLLLV